VNKEEEEEEEVLLIIKDITPKGKQR